MPKKFDVAIGIDPGFQGGISILEGNKIPLVYKMPIKSVVVNKKKKNTYDMEEIVKLFFSYKDKEVLFYIEKQMGLGHESAISTMTIGKNYGQLLGVAYALNFNIVEVTSQSWKKMFPELITDEMRDIKVEMKELRIYGKTLKDKEAKKLNKKQVDKLGRQFKSLAKTEARELVSRLFPSISDKFVKKNTDGAAESVLIVLYGKKLYGKDKQNELV